MSIFSNHRINRAIKLYVIAVFIITAVFSDPVTSVAAVLTLLSYLFFQWRKVNIFANLIANWFVLFALAVLLAPITNSLIAAALALPVFFLITVSLMNTAGYWPNKTKNFSRSPSQLGIMLSVIALLILTLALFLGNLALVLVCGAAVIYLATLFFISFTKVSADSILAEQIHERLVAGTTGEAHITLDARTEFAGILVLDSPYEWVKIHSPVLQVKKQPFALDISLTPQLSGPSEIKIQACVIDIWGLTQSRFTLIPVQLNVIPRAKYAAWLAQKYLDTTRQGMLPLISNVSTIKPRYGMRRGVEYYGSQLYQAGDEMKSIDWKHSARFNKLISKEFVEFNGQPAILLVNLAAADAEEADKLASDVIMTALSLAQEQIPSVLAVYDQYDVKLVTISLQPQQMLTQALGIIKDIRIFDNPTKYLYAPDIGRLRSNMSRLKPVEGQSAQVLTQLMDIEYAHLLTGVAGNPASKAINKAINNASFQSTVVVVSKMNHDANAIQVHKYLMERKGNPLVVV